MTVFFFVISVSEVVDVLQIYNNFTGEHPCRSVCDFSKVAMQFN